MSSRVDAERRQLDALDAHHARHPDRLGPTEVALAYALLRAVPGLDWLPGAERFDAILSANLDRAVRALAVPGIASTMLLNIILAWNEAFWTILLTTVNAAPLTKFIASFSAPEGLFYAKLSAASIMAIAPILIMGWFSQKQLVRGLTFGAVK